MLLRSLALVAILLQTIPALASWKVGDVIPFAQCASFERMEISRVSGPYFLIDNPNYNDRSVLTCSNQSSGASTSYVIDTHYNSATGAYTSKVVKVLTEKDPEILFTQDGSYFRYFVDGYYKDSTGNYQDFTALFYSEEATKACPNGAELKILMVEDQGRISTLGQPKSSGHCLPSAGSLVSPIKGLNILDFDVAQDGTVRIAAYLGLLGSPEEISILEYQATTGSITELTRLSDTKLFPTGCGRYLMTARLLPGSTNVAFAYRSPKLVTVDYANKAVGITELFDGDSGGPATCEGYTPSYSSLRKELWIHTGWNTATPGKKELFFLTRDKNYRPYLFSTPL